MFTDRLDTAFPFCRVRLVWSDEAEAWAIWNYNKVKHSWHFICLWFREPTEDLIDALRVGLVGGRVTPDAVTLVEEDLRAKDAETVRARLKWKAELGARVRDSGHWITDAFSGVVHGPRYVPGWRVA